MYQDLKEVEKKQMRREEDMQRRVEEYTLSGYSECKFSCLIDFYRESFEERPS